MRYSLSWLKEFIELSVPPERLAQRLTLGGLEVNRLEAADGDWLFEAEVTPNRADCLSHLGLARETAAVLGRTFRFPRWLSREFQLPRGEQAAPFPVTIEDTEGCRRYIGIVIEGVEARPSPPEMVKRLEKMGLRSINNIVDVTNLCLLELGQPLHAFDLDRLEGGQIRVRRAKAGEKLRLLDGNECALTADQLVIADAKKPVALAGVMGGLLTQITPNTRRVLLESAGFQPSLIRRGARIAKLSTDSSYRFERGVDPEMVLPAAVRAARWITRIAGGAVVSIADIGQAGMPSPTIPLRPKKAQEILGMKISAGQQRRFLQHIGCQVRASGRNWAVQPPSWRADLKIPEDLHEELARLFGYDRCVPSLPPLPRRPVQPDPLEDTSVEREMQLRRLLAAAGLQEIMGYSLLHPQDPAKVSMFGRGVVELKNPLSLEQAVLRNTLLVGALQAVARNFSWKTSEEFRLFEIGSVFGTSGEGPPPGYPIETRMLGLLVGGISAPSWGQPKQPLGIFHLKGILQLLRERLNFSLEEVPAPSGAPEPGILLKLSGKPVGRLGIVDPSVAAAFEIPEQISLAYAELDLEPYLAAGRFIPKTEPLPKVPPVQRDLAILISQEIPYEKISAAIREEGLPLLKSLELFDLYQGTQVPQGKKSLAIRLKFLDGDRTLTEAEIQAAHQKILDRLQKEFSGILRY
ncbi:MAG: phenylalanine--tRNA ligase subunit beta [Candidatus Omnitrophota bacterium]|nr:phenylalanine--tRNA ligase subunit beta [Candidatus Omnitrophota bacterium]